MRKEQEIIFCEVRELTLEPAIAMSCRFSCRRQTRTKCSSHIHCEGLPRKLLPKIICTYLDVNVSFVLDPLMVSKRVISTDFLNLTFSASEDRAAGSGNEAESLPRHSSPFHGLTSPHCSTVYSKSTSLQVYTLPVPPCTLNPHLCRFVRSLFHRVL